MADGKKEYVKWSKTFLCGIQIIDDQHKELVRLINDMYAHTNGNAEDEFAFFSKAIHIVVSYVGEHFQTEEKLMLRTKYPGYLEHKEAHSTFVMSVIETAKNFKMGKRFVLTEFTEYLKEWTLSHIAFNDKDFANYVKAIASRKVDGKLSIDTADLSKL